MKSFYTTSGFRWPLLLLMAGVIPSVAAAQSPIVPIVVDTTVPIIVNTVKPKPKATGLAKFEGYVQNANIAEITVRAKGNDLAIETFSLSASVAAKMQQIVDKGGYQFGDKVTIVYDPLTMKAMKIKGKASKPV
jgi:hypothetical protein